MNENIRDEVRSRWFSMRREFVRPRLWRFALRHAWWFLTCWCPRPYWCLENDGQWCAYDNRKDAERDLLDFHEDGCCWPKKNGDLTPDCAPVPPGRVCGIMVLRVQWMTPLRLASFGEFDGWW